MLNSHDGIEYILSLLLDIELFDITEAQRTLINHYTAIKPIPVMAYGEYRDKYIEDLLDFLISIDVYFKVNYSY